MQSLICELQEDLQSQNRTKTLTELSEDVQNHEPHVNVGEYLGGFLFQMIYEIKKIWDLTRDVMKSFISFMKAIFGLFYLFISVFLIAL